MLHIIYVKILYFTSISFAFSSVTKLSVENWNNHKDGTNQTDRKQYFCMKTHVITYLVLFVLLQLHLLYCFI